MSQPQLLAADYSSDPVLEEDGSQARVCLTLAWASLLVAQQFGPDQHQDIEGVVTQDGRLYVVQTRPQA